jgi:hypothetical protein
MPKRKSQSSSFYQPTCKSTTRTEPIYGKPTKPQVTQHPLLGLLVCLLVVIVILLVSKIYMYCVPNMGLTDRFPVNHYTIKSNPYRNKLDYDRIAFASYSTDEPVLDYNDDEDERNLILFDSQHNCQQASLDYESKCLVF